MYVDSLKKAKEYSLIDWVWSPAPNKKRSVGDTKKNQQQIRHDRAVYLDKKSYELVTRKVKENRIAHRQRKNEDFATIHEIWFPGVYDVGYKHFLHKHGLEKYYKIRINEGKEELLFKIPRLVTQVAKN